MNPRYTTHQAHRDGGDRASAERFFAQSIKVAQLSAAGRGTVLKTHPFCHGNLFKTFRSIFLPGAGRIKVAQLLSGGRGPVLNNSPPLPREATKKSFSTSIFPFTIS